MKNGKLIAVLVAAAIIVGMTPALAMATGHDSTYCMYDGPRTLFGGQHIPVGTVEVANDWEMICVTYKIDQCKADEGWVFTELHLHIASTVSDLPANRQGNPIPGHFEHKARFDIDDAQTEWTFCMALADLGVTAGSRVYIAAHAVVEKEEVVDTVQQCIVSDTDTLYCDDGQWKSTELAWVHGSWNNPAGIVALIAAGARWIWESEFVNNPVDGDIVEFERHFTIPGRPISGWLHITADNGYEANMNGGFVGSANLYGDWRTSNLTQVFVDSGNWQSVESWNVSTVLVSGLNTLAITGVNEYMGPMDGQSYGTVTSNPGGVIYQLCYEYEVVHEHEKESAWADGERFVQRGNWATYFCYEAECVLVHVDTVYVTPYGTASFTPIPTFSNVVLEAGVNYRLEASGTYRFANWGEYGVADAAWNYRRAANAPGGIPGWYQQASQALQVWVDGAPVLWQPAEFNPDHIYMLDLVGGGAALEFSIMDDYYPDNSGFITVKIYRCAP